MQMYVEIILCGMAYILKMFFLFGVLVESTVEQFEQTRYLVF